MIGGIPFAQGPIAYTLKNRTYVGELNHRKCSYPADHAPIVPRELFDAVQRELEAKRAAQAAKHHASGALLIGKLFDRHGRPMTPTYACKGARRYRYYISRPDRADPNTPKQPISRVRADELNQQVVLALESIFPAVGGLSGNHAHLRVADRRVSLVASCARHRLGS